MAMSKCEWDATTPYHCLTHNTQWLDDESDRCEYKRMCDAEAAIARVRDVLDEWDDLVIDGEDPEEHIIRALDDNNNNKGVNND